MKNSESPSQNPAFPIALILLAAFTLSLTKVTNVDVWAFLKTGEYILDNHIPPYNDPFSYTLKGHIWHGQAWLSPVIFHLLYKRWGIESLVVLKALMFTAMFALLLAVFRRRRVSTWLSVLVLLLVLFVVKKRLMVRGEVITWLFMALFMYVLESYRYRKRVLLFLPFLMILWANLHVGCIFGVGILFAYFAGETVNYCLRRQKGHQFNPAPNRTELISFAAVLLVTVGAAFINPNVHEIFTTPLLIGTDSFLVANVDELSFPGVMQFKLCWTMVALCLAGVFLRLRHVDPVDFFLLAVFLPVSLKVQRNIPMFAIIGAPVLAQHWHVLLERFAGVFASRLRIGGRASVSWKTLANVSISLLVVVVSASALRRHHRSDILGCGINDRWPGYPKGACDFIERENLQGNVLNWDGFGSYFIFRFWPRRSVFVDGRFGQVYPSTFLENVYFHLWHAEPGWPRMLESHGIQYTLVSIDDKSSLVRTIGRSENWKLVYWDDFAKIYVKDKVGENAEKFPFAYEVISLEDNRLSFLDDPDQTQRALLEVRHALLESPYCSKAHGLLGAIYCSLGKLDPAITAYEKSLDLNPHQLYLHYHLGIVYEFSGEYEKAIEQYKEEIRRTPHFVDTYERLGRVYRLLGHVQRAEKFEQRAARIQPVKNHKIPRD